MRYITNSQFKKLTGIPRARLAQRTLVFSGVLIEENNKILLVKSKKTKYPGWDIPGGKVLWSENVNDTCIREALEETGYNVELAGVVGVFQRDTGVDDEEYLRVIFTGKVINYDDTSERDGNIDGCDWISLEDVSDIDFRSKQVLKEIQRYNKGKTYPLELIDTFIW